MVTIYDLLEVEEDASTEEIEKAYSKLVLEFRQDLKFDDVKNKENEMIVNKLKLAYDILSDDEKRKKYDEQLAQKRAENLIENISITNEIEQTEKQTAQEVANQESFNNINTISQNNLEQQDTQIQPQNRDNNISSKPIREMKNRLNNENDEDLLTKEEKNKIQKAAKAEFKKKLKKAKQAEAEYEEAYNKAYNDYLRKNGYQVEEPWTFKRFIRTVIAIFIVIVFLFILWHIPPVNKFLVKLYEENFIIRALVNIVKSIIDAITK